MIKYLFIYKGKLGRGLSHISGVLGSIRKGNPCTITGRDSVNLFFYLVYFYLDSRLNAYHPPQTIIKCDVIGLMWNKLLAPLER